VFFVQSCAVCNAETESGVFCPTCRLKELLLEAMPGLLNLDGAVMGYKYSGALKEMLHKLKFEANFCSRWQKKLHF
jgi:predicted amidophosphoribosyltransferase